MGLVEPVALDERVGDVGCREDPRHLRRDRGLADARASAEEERLRGDGPRCSRGVVQHPVDPLVPVEGVHLRPPRPTHLDELVVVERQLGRGQRAPVGDRHVRDAVAVRVGRLERGAAVRPDDRSDPGLDAELLPHLACERLGGILAGLDRAADEAPPARVALPRQQEAVAVLDHRGHRGQEQQVVPDA